MAVSVFVEKCDRCGTCISVCPANALMLLTETLVLDVKRCTGCGTCVTVCPFGALQPVSSDAALSGRAGIDRG